MKYLIKSDPFRSSPLSECYMLGYPCGDAGGCPSLCIGKCSVKATNCSKPLGPGFSPTGDDSSALDE